MDENHYESANKSPISFTTVVWIFVIIAAISTAIFSYLKKSKQTAQTPAGETEITLLPDAENKEIKNSIYEEIENKDKSESKNDKKIENKTTTAKTIKKESKQTVPTATANASGQNTSTSTQNSPSGASASASASASSSDENSTISVSSSISSSSASVNVN